MYINSLSFCTPSNIYNCLALSNVPLKLLLVTQQEHNSSGNRCGWEEEGYWMQEDWTKAQKKGRQHWMFQCLLILYAKSAHDQRRSLGSTYCGFNLWWIIPCIIFSSPIHLPAFVMGFPAVWLEPSNLPLSPPKHPACAPSFQPPPMNQSARQWNNIHHHLSKHSFAHTFTQRTLTWKDASWASVFSLSLRLATASVRSAMDSLVHWLMSCSAALRSSQSFTQ